MLALIIIAVAVLASQTAAFYAGRFSKDKHKQPLSLALIICSSIVIIHLISKIIRELS